MPKRPSPARPNLTTTVRTRISDECRKRLEKAADREARTISALIRLIINNWLADY
jgi:predicted DNA-binding protein